MEIIEPLMVHVAMTFLIAIALGISRYKAASTGQVKLKDIALRQPNWPPKTTKISNAFQNQLETPILFYLLSVLLLITKQVDATYVMLAWGYIAARLVHLTIHLTINHVVARFLAFITSMTILIAMWGRFALVNM